MLESTIIRRDIDIARRLALRVITVFAIVGLVVAPAHAGMMASLSCESSPIDRDLASLDGMWTSMAPFLELRSVGLGSWGAPTSSIPIAEQPAVPTTPTKRLASELPILNVEVLMSTGEGGAGATGSSSGGGESSFNWMIVCCVSELTPPTFLGLLKSSEVHDIPPAPPFELLRPPQVLTIFA